MSDSFDSWAILELMGHVRMAGRVTEEERFGVKMGRIDVPKAEGGFTTVYFGGGSVYRMTPTTEAIARHVAASAQPQPVSRWELPSPEKAAAAFTPSPRGPRPDPDDEDDDRDYPDDEDDLDRYGDD